MARAGREDKYGKKAEHKAVNRKEEIKERIPVLMMTLGVISASGVLLYLLNPLKGLSWVIIYDLQAVVSFFIPYYGYYRKKYRAYGDTPMFRLLVLRHLIWQMGILCLYLFVGLLSFRGLGERSGPVSLIVIMILTAAAVWFEPGFLLKNRLTPGKTERKLLTVDLYLYAFLIPVGVQVLLFAVYSVFPFGKEAYLRMDCFHQYAPFLREFHTRMHNGEGLFFAWENGLGVNYWAHFAYYLSSPFNLLYLLLPKQYLIEGIEAGIVLKGGLASLSFLYYLNSRWKNRNVLRLLFAVFYGLSAYFLAYSCNIMWPDCYILFPLVMLGVERIAEGKNSGLFGTAFFLSVLSNFYISAIAGIAVVLYFIANLVIYRKEGRVLLKIANFILTTVVVLLMAGVILLPVYLCLKNTAAGASEFPDTWKAYFGFHELFARMLIHKETVQNGSDLPNLYGSVLALSLLPVYFTNGNVKPESKITKGLLMLFLLFSFQWNVLTYVWHGLHFPNSFPARQSFFFIFLLISMGAECMEQWEAVGKKRIVIITGILIAGCVLLGVFLGKGDWLEIVSVYVCSAILILLYAVAYYFSESMGKKLFKAILIMVAMIECLSNTLAVGINSTINREGYVEEEEKVAAGLAWLKSQNDDNAGFFRVEKANRKHMNEAAWHGYYGASYFSSTISGGVMEFYQAMGLRYSDVAYSYQGASPFLTSLLGVDYVISGEEKSPGETFRGYEAESNGGTLYIYENKYPLGIAYGVPSDADDKFEPAPAKHPFQNQQELYRLLLAEEISLGDGLYKILPVYGIEKNKTSRYGAGIPKDVTGTATVYRVTAGEHPYFYVREYIDSVRIIEENAEGEVVAWSKEEDLKFRHILDLGVSEEDRFIYFYNEDDPSMELSFQAYCFQNDAYERLMDRLSEDRMTIESYSSTHMKGSIHCSQDETLLFAIPYDTGFTVRIDGNEVDTKPFLNAFLSVPVTEGEHSVELSYIPPGFRMGVWLSITGILLAVLGSLLAKRIRGGYNETSLSN